LALALCFSSSSYSEESTTSQDLLCPECEVESGVDGDVDQRNGINVYGFRGGEEVYRSELQQHLTEAQLQAGFDLEGTVSALACLNTIGTNMSCENVGDPTPGTMRMTLTVSDGVAAFEQVQEYSVSNPPSKGWRRFDVSLSVPENELTLSSTYAALNIFGTDDGFWGGNYGIATRKPGLSMEYQTNPVVESTTQDTVTRQVLESVENQIAAPSTPSFMEQSQTEIAAVETEVQEIEEPSAEPEPSVEDIEIDDIEIDGSQQDDIRVPSNLAGAGAGAARSAAKMAAMAQAAADVSDYRAVTYPDAQFYEPAVLDGGETWDNPASRKWTTGADQRMEAMIDMQWSE